MLLTIFALLAVALVVAYVWYYYHYIPKCNAPYLPAKFLVGHALDFNVDNMHLFTERGHRELGLVHQILLPGLRSVCVADWDLVEQLVEMEKGGLLLPKFQNPAFSHSLGRGLVLLPGAELWKRHRKGLKPAFLKSTMRNLWNGHMGRILSDTLKAIDSNPTNVNISDLAFRVTAETVWALLTGLPLNTICAPDLHPVFSKTKRLVDIGMIVSFKPWKGPFLASEGKQLRIWLDDYNRDVISQVKKRMEDGEITAETCLFARTLTEGIISEEELLDECVTLIFAAQDTTASTIAFLLGELARHPEEQKKARDNVEEVLGGGDITYENHTRLRYLWQCCQESTRLHSPVPLIPWREALQDIQVGKWFIPKGAVVTYTQQWLHKSPERWKDADSFLPSRFENGACLGRPMATLEIQGVVGHLLRNYDISLAPGQPQHEDGIAEKYGGTLNPQPILMNFARRGP